MTKSLGTSNKNTNTCAQLKLRLKQVLKETEEYSVFTYQLVWSGFNYADEMFIKC